MATRAAAMLAASIFFFLEYTLHEIYITAAFLLLYTFQFNFILI
jgi:hypothetical protein